MILVQLLQVSVCLVHSRGGALVKRKCGFALASVRVCVRFFSLFLSSSFLTGCKRFNEKKRHDAVSNGRSLREEGHVTYEDAKSGDAAAVDVLNGDVDDRRSVVEVAASL